MFCIIQIEGEEVFAIGFFQILEQLKKKEYSEIQAQLKFH